MRKNRMMRLASALLILTMVTTCAISGTFAKYVTSDTATDAARVAKWGVTVTGKVDSNTVQGNNTLFEENYDDTVVSSETNVAVLAPGTDGEMTNFVITGTPEVDVTVTYAATFSIGDKWKDADAADYCPVTITVNSDTFALSSYSSVTEFEDAVEGAINGYTKSYEANTNLSTKTTDDLIVSWAWPYVGDDVKDTYLGDQAAGGNAASINLSVTCTVTQVD